jgi:imidazolonepropionase
MSLFITNIKQLVNVRSESHVLRGKELSEIFCVEDAYLVIEGSEIAEYGQMSDLPYHVDHSSTFIDASGQFILPCWCDSHTHLVFAGYREEEFVDKLKGGDYAQINERGGGILHSVNMLNETSEDELFNQSWKRLQEVARLGTGAIEIKSGYGLTLEGEMKMLRVIKKLKDKSRLSIRATFLGAHTYPLAYRDNHKGYLDLLINEMLPQISAEKLADYIDVFCEKGFFSPLEMETICTAGKAYGLKPKLHVNQLSSIGGIQTGIQMDAVSMDHLESLTENDIQMLSGSKSTLAGKIWRGIGTLLPTAAFFLRLPLQPARRLIDSGCAIALASDYNPGSSPSGNMNFVISLSCIQMKMLPEEAINAGTVNGAYALELGSELGSITVGKKANLVFTKPMTSLAYLPYSFGSNLIDKVMIKGDFIS